MSMPIFPLLKFQGVMDKLAKIVKKYVREALK